jgi:hypothetical protein
VKIETQSAFTTQIAVATSNFNLLTMRDLYEFMMLIFGEVIIPVSPLNLNGNQIQIGGMLVAVLLILGILS